MDSYKLVRLRLVAASSPPAAPRPASAYLVNIGLLAVTGMDFDSYARTLAPLVEEV